MDKEHRSKVANFSLNSQCRKVPFVLEHSAKGCAQTLVAVTRVNMPTSHFAGSGPTLAARRALKDIGGELQRERHRQRETQEKVKKSQSYEPLHLQALPSSLRLGLPSLAGQTPIQRHGKRVYYHALLIRKSN